MTLLRNLGRAVALLLAVATAVALVGGLVALGVTVGTAGVLGGAAAVLIGVLS